MLRWLLRVLTRFKSFQRSVFRGLAAKRQMILAERPNLADPQGLEQDDANESAFKLFQGGLFYKVDLSVAVSLR